MPELNYILLDSTDPAWNLAAEQAVFDLLPRDRSYLMLWRNDNAVIIGKYQNTLAEINKPYIDANQIRVVRRLSGGGAVYHDLGNLNYTFITDARNTETLDLHLFCQPVVRTLTALGVPAEANGRNDITADGKKVSGSAQYLRGGRIMHHGTLLFDSDLNVVSHALHVDKEKIRAKGLLSVRSRVTNIRPFLREDCTILEFRDKLLANLLRETPGSIYRFTPDDLSAIDTLRQERYNSWDWNYGASRECTILKRARFEGCGTVEASLSLDGGRIRELRFTGDFFSLREPEELAAKLTGLRLEAADLCAALADSDVGQYFMGLSGEALLNLLCS